VKSGGNTLTSNKVPFNLKVLPPNPILLSPPVTLHRTWISEEEDKPLTLSPINTEIKILLEFPMITRAAWRTAVSLSTGSWNRKIPLRLTIPLAGI